MRFTSSLSANKAVTVSCVAFFATSPPLANFLRISSAFKFNNSNPSVVLSAVSFTRIPNSLYASPNLSTLNVPFCEPFIKELKNSSAVNPSCL